jgi:hypothetical protein
MKIILYAASVLAYWVVTASVDWGVRRQAARLETELFDQKCRSMSSA